MMDYSEKRDFIRMHVNCPIALRDAAGAGDGLAELRDLSASGMRFVTRSPMAEGARLQVTVRPGNPITPPLEARVAVVRCDAIDQGFDIAAEIETIEPAGYPVAD